MDINTLIISMYREGKSTYEICEELNKSGTNNFYPNRINRLLKKYGEPLRNKSESQKIVLSSNRSAHPTKGKERTAEEKIKIGQGIHTTWSNISEEKRKAKSDKAKKNWENFSQEHKDALHKSAAKAVRKSADTGSKVERFILGKLRQNDYKVDFHTRLILPVGTLELDIYLPELSVAIEVNGVSHYSPVHGQEAFDRVQYNDKIKDGMALQNGLTMIRIKSIVNKVGLTHCANLWNQLEKELEKIKANPNQSVENRLIYIGE